MLKKYLDITNWTAPNLAAIDTSDLRSAIFKTAIVSYGTIRLRMRNLSQSSNCNTVILNWDTPICGISHYIDDWLYSILHTLKLECSTPERAATYFYHRIYSSISTKRALAAIHPELCNGCHQDEFDELVRLVFVELPHLYDNLAK